MKQLSLFGLLLIISLVLSACSLAAEPAAAAPVSQAVATPAATPAEQPVEEGAVTEPVEEGAVTEPVEEEAVTEPVEEEAVEEAAPAESAEGETQEAKSINEIAKEDERLTNLAAGIEAAGLAETFAGEGPFTVFAPTDEAFAALSESTKQSLYADPKGAFRNILLFHTVDGVVTAEELLGLAAVSTQAGQNVGVSVVGDGQIVLEGYAQVIVADIEASNGVIHVINAVLIPAGRG
jgi:uncharacterized surface protein with fasciclin (FAS1) repeats